MSMVFERDEDFELPTARLKIENKHEYTISISNKAAWRAGMLVGAGICSGVVLTLLGVHWTTQAIKWVLS